MTPNDHDPFADQLRSRWQPPAVSPDSMERFLARPLPEARRGPGAFRARPWWLAAGGALAAGLALLLVVQSRPPAPAAPVVASAHASLTDEDVLSFVYATYELEESL